MKLSTSRKERLYALCSHVRKQSFCNNRPPGGILEQRMNFLVLFVIKIASQLCKLRYFRKCYSVISLRSSTTSENTYRIRPWKRPGHLYWIYRQVLRGGRIHESLARKFEYHYFLWIAAMFHKLKDRSTIIMMLSQHVLLLTCTLPGHNYIFWNMQSNSPQHNIFLNHIY